MRTLWIAGGVALASLGASGALAHDRGGNWSPGWRYERAIQQTRYECNQSLRWANSQREYNRIARRCDDRLEDLQREYRRQMRSGWRGGWDHDHRWRGYDHDDDDDDDDD